MVRFLNIRNYILFKCVPSSSLVVNSRYNTYISLKLSDGFLLSPIFSQSIVGGSELLLICAISESNKTIRRCFAALRNVDRSTDEGVFSLEMSTKMELL